MKERFGKDPEEMYVEELKRALFEKCSSIAEYLEIMEAIEDRVYGPEDGACEFIELVG